MTCNRRQFVTVSSLGLVGAFGNRSLFAQGRGPQPPVITAFVDVRRNVSVFTARGGTIGLLVLPDAVVVVDSQFADTAPLFLDGLKPKTSRRIDFLINSHHHGDHTGGNKVLQPSVGEDRRPYECARPADEGGRGRQDGSEPGLRRHDLREGMENVGRQRDGVGEVTTDRRTPAATS